MTSRLRAWARCRPSRADQLRVRLSDDVLRLAEVLLCVVELGPGRPTCCHDVETSFHMRQLERQVGQALTLGGLLCSLHLLADRLLYRAELLPQILDARPRRQRYLRGLELGSNLGQIL